MSQPSPILARLTFRLDISPYRETVAASWDTPDGPAFGTFRRHSFGPAAGRYVMSGGGDVAWCHWPDLTAAGICRTIDYGPDTFGACEIILSGPWHDAAERIAAC